jgi:hypothetical protein
LLRVKKDAYTKKIAGWGKGGAEKKGKDKSLPVSRDLHVIVDGHITGRKHHV